MALRMADAISTGCCAAAMAVSDCLCVMEAVGDKLKLLDYEVHFVRARGVRPLPCGYFTGAPAAATVEPVSETAASDGSTKEERKAGAMG